MPAAMSKPPRALQEVMTAVDAGHAVLHVNVDSGSSDNLLGPRRRSTNYGRGGARTVAVVEASKDASFEFSTAFNSSSSASPASMVFSEGQIRAHQFPAVRSSAASAGSNQLATPPVRSSTVGRSYSSSTKQQQAGVAGSKNRVSFATDGGGKAAVAAKAGGGQGKKSGGLLGCCGASARNEAVEPVGRNDNRKVEAF